MMTMTPKFPWIAGFVLLDMVCICLLGGVNESLFLSMNRAFSSLPESFWQVVTTLSDPLVAPLIVFSLFYRHPAFIRTLLIALLIGLALNYGLKNAFGVPRPEAALVSAAFNKIGPTLTSFSFPSGHTLTVFLMAGLISAWYQHRNLSVLVFVVASLIGLGRIAVGAHWPADVAFGALLGWLSGWAAVKISTYLPAIIPDKAQMAMYGLTLFTGIYAVMVKTAYPDAQWLNTAAALFVIAYSVRKLTELIHLNKN